MKVVLKFLGVVFAIVLILALMRLVWTTLGLFPFMILLFYYGLVVNGFFQYRHIRQEEVLYLLKTASGAEAPLSPALWRYLRDRPPTAWREFWVALFQFFVLPGYYWFWHRKHRFDKRVERLAVCLETGRPLSSSLLAVSGVVPRETILAAAVGESTGQMAVALDSIPRRRVATLWLEAAPRLVYPLFIFLAMSGILAYQAIYIIPKFEKIFLDFKIKLPAITEDLIWFERYILFRWGTAILLGLILVPIVTFFSSTLCWHMPILRRFYRAHCQGRIMSMLATLLKAKQPVPASLAILVESGYFGAAVRGRINRSRALVEQGTPLADSLYRCGLLPGSMVPLLHAAERAHNLPWALGELGETLSARVARNARRFTMGIFPFMIVLMGGLVAFVVLGTFMPLLKIMAELNL